MERSIKWAINRMPKTEDKNLPIMAVEEVKKARAFHESFPQYSVTPLADLKETAGHLGLSKICVKDESYRFGLNAFKVLGGSYAIARYIAKEIGKDVSELPYNVLTSKEVLEKFGQATFYSATDGNHGRGVAWAANRLGQKCIIRMPVGSTETRRKHIEDEGAECTIEKVNYDDCVRMVAKEASEQYGEKPTHVFIQAGVGSLAGGIVGYFANKYGKEAPIMCVVEAEPAACLYKGAVAGDGDIRICDGEMPTIMAGLCCGEPNITSWDILKNHVTAFLAVGDDISRKGMRMLAASLKGDRQVISGESGAAPFGAVAEIMENDEYRELRDALKLDKDSKVLLFSTEGDTDPERWKNIVWYGKDK